MAEAASHSAKRRRPSADRDVLPYVVELWAQNRDKVEKVLARAAVDSLARAIFQAALKERPGRRVTLRRGARVLADSKA